MVQKIITGIFLMLVILLSGCAAVQFSSASWPEVTLSTPGVVATQAPTPDTTETTTEVLVRAPGTTYSYGRFKVLVAKDGSQQIEGGVFVPNAQPPLLLSRPHTIFVNYTTKELSYYRQTPQGVKAVVGYAVVTPVPTSLPSVVVEGVVTQIDTAPWWCPTPNIRKKYPDLPKGCLPPGHKENAMGIAKFIIDWQLPKALKAEWSTIRLHGATGYPPGDFWGEETFGCTRLVDSALKSLIKNLGPEAVREGIKIVVMKGNSFVDRAL
jgi:hypothetical protein